MSQSDLPRGFQFASVDAGIRKVRRADLALVWSARPAAAAAMFTTNLVQAAPVRLAREHLQRSRGRVRAILVNAGNANCATRTGEKVARQTCEAVAANLPVPVEQVFPASTGVIGVELDARLIVNALPALIERLPNGAFEEAAEAILTTDTRAKHRVAGLRVKSGAVRIAAFTKGSGMIHPNMATTLGFFLTDAAIAVPALRTLLRNAMDRSYHCLSVDSDTSTNDTVLLAANGASEIAPEGKDAERFAALLTEIAADLAREIARDGEGAKKLITIQVRGAKSDADARRIGRAIANSPLCKTAIAGADPNWGRLLSAAGASGVTFNPAKTDIKLQGVAVCKSGLAAPFDEAALAARLADPEITIDFRIRDLGPGEATFFTCDLTHGYIDINASYRT